MMRVAIPAGVIVALLAAAFLFGAWFPAAVAVAVAGALGWWGVAVVLGFALDLLFGAPPGLVWLPVPFVSLGILCAAARLMVGALGRRSMPYSL